MLVIRVWEHVRAARVIGATAPRIALKHVLPGTTSNIIVALSLRAQPPRITGEAGLSFLGLGVPPPTPSFNERRWPALYRRRTRGGPGRRPSRLRSCFSGLTLLGDFPAMSLISALFSPGVLIFDGRTRGRTSVCRGPHT